MPESKQKINIFLVFTLVLFFLVICVGKIMADTATEGLATVSWVAPTTDEGSTAPITDLAGFLIYYGTASQGIGGTCPTLVYGTAVAPYTNIINNTSPDATSQLIENLGVGNTYYFAVAAYDEDHNVSSCATVNGSGATEVSRLATYKGDLNNDTEVGELDFSVLHAYYDTNNIAGDCNRDGTVDALDFSIIHAEWGIDF
jgi:hypothetical protein